MSTVTQSPWTSLLPFQAQNRHFSFLIFVCHSVLCSRGLFMSQFLEEMTHLDRDEGFNLTTGTAVEDVNVNNEATD